MQWFFVSVFLQIDPVIAMNTLHSWSPKYIILFLPVYFLQNRDHIAYGSTNTLNATAKKYTTIVCSTSCNFRGISLYILF